MSFGISPVSANLQWIADPHPFKESLKRRARFLKAYSFASKVSKKNRDAQKIRSESALNFVNPTALHYRQEENPELARFLRAADVHSLVLTLFEENQRLQNTLNS